jgi:hypothetical protein
MDKPSSRLCRATCLLACLALAAPAAAQQYVEETGSRFPSPNPTEFTNQGTLGDIDDDGDLDIIFANGGNFSSPGIDQLVRVYVNNGSGVFTDESVARTGGVTGLHRGVELGDCDDDGDLDLLLVQDFNRLPNLLINDGNGVFTPEGGTRLPNITLASSRGQFGDIDNDGDLDLFITSGTTSRFSCGQYRVYENDGSCFYTDITNSNFPIGCVSNNMDCIFGDVDGDFDLDIKTASTGNNNSRLYLNDGGGIYTVDNTVPADSSCYSYDFGDIDGDGDLDLLGANGNSGNTDILLENDGSGGYTNISTALSPNPNEDDNDSKFLDMDNDGDLDLIIARLGSPGEKLYRNDGFGNFGLTSGVFQAIADSSLDVLVGDLTGNGAYDVVTCQGESGNYQNRIYINNGPADTIEPHIVDTEQVTMPDDAGPYVVRAAILDHMTSDRNFFDQGIDLHYEVDGGATDTVAMKHSGGQIYRGEIPGQAPSAGVEYWVTANDWNGNRATGQVLSFVVPNCSGVGSCSGNGTCIGADLCDCNDPWEGPDCSQFNPTEGGSVPDGVDDGLLSPLRMRKIGGDLGLTWNNSCGPDDDNYAVYRGEVGDYTSHEPMTCSNGLTTFYVFTPIAGSHYYLVVPTTPNAEGSYGLDSDGLERPPSVAGCAAHAPATCP